MEEVITERNLDVNDPFYGTERRFLPFYYD
jgi:hypothetical protein